MSVAFSSSAEDVLRRRVEIRSKSSECRLERIDEILELQRCAEWIRANSLQRVALQFPDELLCHAVEAVNYLTPLVSETKLYVLGDTSFGSCCLDEVAAHHASCEGIIHFGHSCLSAPTTLKTLLIFGVHHVDWEPLQKKLLEETRLVGGDLFVFVDTKYCSHLDAIEKVLPDSAVIGKPALPGDTFAGGQVALKRRFNTEKSFNSESSRRAILWIGDANRTFTSLILYFNSWPVWSYDPESTELKQEGLTISRSLLRRHYLVEKAKDARIVGILVGTLGVKNFREAITHLRTLIRSAGKRSYTLAVGKLNVAKLANFQEIDVFVYVACPESTFFDSKEFYRPVVTPYELEVALNPNRQWGAHYFTDFDDILPGGCAHVEVPEEGEENGREYDVSLISGRLRAMGGGGGENVEESTAATDCAALIKKEQTVSVVHVGGAGTTVESIDGGGEKQRKNKAKKKNKEKTIITKMNEELSLDAIIAVSSKRAILAGDVFSQRSWRGLDPQFGKTAVATTIKQGRDGIAMAYAEEGQDPTSSSKPNITE